MQKVSLRGNGILSIPDEFQSLALRRLKELEKAVDRIDLSVVESSVHKYRKPGKSRGKYADMAMKELDDIMEDIEKLMKVDWCVS